MTDIYNSVPAYVREAWNVTSELDALAAAYAEHHGSGGDAVGVEGSGTALALANDSVPDTVTS